MAELSKTNYLTWFKFQIDLSLLCIVQLERGDGKEGGGGPKEGKGGEVEDPQRGNGVVEDPPPTVPESHSPWKISLSKFYWNKNGTELRKICRCKMCRLGIIKNTQIFTQKSTTIREHFAT